MESITKDIDYVYINKESSLLKKIINNEIDKRIEYCKKILKEKVNICEEALLRVSGNNWINIKNKDLLYYKSNHVLVPNLKRKTIEEFIPNYNKVFKLLCNGDIDSAKKGLKPVEGINMDFMNKKDVEYLFSSKIKNPLQDNNNYIYDKNKIKYKYLYYVENDNLYSYSVTPYYEDRSLILPICKCQYNEKITEVFVINNLKPSGINEKEDEAFDFLIKLYNDNYLTESMEITNETESSLKNQEIKSFMDVSFETDKITSCFSQGVSSGSINSIEEEYLKCDKIRGDIEEYDIGQIYEVNRGHWDLWDIENKKSNNDFIKIKLNKPLIARNPLADINRNGIVAIDFGTKSTVVVVIDDNSRIHQMRIGSGNLKKEVKKTDYENPTVMEFRDILDFMERYQSEMGRPNTLWNDITISHSAADCLQNAQNSEEYYSFLCDLKQWSDDSIRKIKIKDLNHHEETLRDFLEIDDKSLNPIEIYAYYLGLAINNMRNGIYMDYILSYPVNYPVKVREKIVESFKKGIMKSLPVELIDNEECMKLFRVQAGVSEPAAYAISALKGYGFEPEEDEKYFYGIFDFGGGTTDFDFGIWRGAKDKECRRYDYVIEHFGAGGDKYLGGENLLELLAFDVFKDNSEIMLEKEIPFFKPQERSVFSGSEMLLSTSQEARLNTRQLMEKLRCFWESGSIVDDNNENAKEDNISECETIENEILNSIKEGIIKVTLFNKSGNVIPNVELKVDEKKLQKVLIDRIRVGVINFFEAIKNTIITKDLIDIDKINIFLAGNSCKSPIVKKLFLEVMDEKENEIKKVCKNINLDSNNFFVIYPALGTPEADKIQEELGITNSNDLKEYEKPTGKTGVAYGLIEGRNASRIKVISEVKSDEEAKFKFYIGYEKKGKFHVEIERNIDYNIWVEFIDAYEKDFELLYTSLPEATTNQMDVTRVKRMPCRINESYDEEDINVYLRAVEPDTLEYVTGKYEDVLEGKFLEGPYKVKLTD